jgi:hypothetical protein
VGTTKFAGGSGADAIPKFQNRNDTWPQEGVGTGPPEENIEVSSEQPLVIAEKYSVLRVTCVKTNFPLVVCNRHTDIYAVALQEGFHIPGGLPRFIMNHHLDCGLTLSRTRQRTE